MYNCISVGTRLTSLLASHRATFVNTWHAQRGHSRALNASLRIVTPRWCTSTGLASSWGSTPSGCTSTTTRYWPWDDNPISSGPGSLSNRRSCSFWYSYTELQNIDLELELLVLVHGVAVTRWQWLVGAVHPTSRTDPSRWLVTGLPVV